MLGIISLLALAAYLLALLDNANSSSSEQFVLLLAFVALLLFACGSQEPHNIFFRRLARASIIFPVSVAGSRLLESFGIITAFGPVEIVLPSSGFVAVLVLLATLLVFLLRFQSCTIDVREATSAPPPRSPSPSPPPPSPPSPVTPSYGTAPPPPPPPGNPAPALSQSPASSRRPVVAHPVVARKFTSRPRRFEHMSLQEAADMRERIEDEEMMALLRARRATQMPVVAPASPASSSPVTSALSPAPVAEMPVVAPSPPPSVSAPVAATVTAAPPALPALFFSPRSGTNWMQRSVLLPAPMAIKRLGTFKVGKPSRKSVRAAPGPAFAAAIATMQLPVVSPAPAVLAAPAPAPPVILHFSGKDWIPRSASSPPAAVLRPTMAPVKQLFPMSAAAAQQSRAAFHRVRFLTIAARQHTGKRGQATDDDDDDDETDEQPVPAAQAPPAPAARSQQRAKLDEDTVVSSIPVLNAPMFGHNGTLLAIHNAIDRWYQLFLPWYARVQNSTSSSAEDEACKALIIATILADIKIMKQIYVGKHVKDFEDPNVPGAFRVAQRDKYKSIGSRFVPKMRQLCGEDEKVKELEREMMECWQQMLWFVNEVAKINLLNQYK